MGLFEGREGRGERERILISRRVSFFLSRGANYGSLVCEGQGA